MLRKETYHRLVFAIGLGSVLGLLTTLWLSPTSWFLGIASGALICASATYFGFDLKETWQAIKLAFIQAKIKTQFLMQRVFQSAWKRFTSSCHTIWKITIWPFHVIYSIGNLLYQIWRKDITNYKKHKEVRKSNIILATMEVINSTIFIVCCSALLFILYHHPEIGHEIDTYALITVFGVFLTFAYLIEIHHLWKSMTSQVHSINTSITFDWVHMILDTKGVTLKKEYGEGVYGNDIFFIEKKGKRRNLYWTEAIYASFFMWMIFSTLTASIVGSVTYGYTMYLIYVVAAIIGIFLTGVIGFLSYSLSSYCAEFALMLLVGFFACLLYFVLGTFFYVYSHARVLAASNALVGFAVGCSWLYRHSQSTTADTILWLITCATIGIICGIAQYELISIRWLKLEVNR